MFRKVYLMFASRGKLYRFRQRDAALLERAVSKGLTDNQVAVIRDYLTKELDDMSIASVENSRRLAFAVVFSIVCNGLITIVNGTGFSIPGVIGTQVISFYLGASPTIVNGIAAALFWESKKLKSTEAMNALRFELWQFLGESSEYDGLAPDEAWRKVSEATERILQKYFSHEAIGPQKKDQRQQKRG